ncbi:MAG TPA: NfeD family protein [Solirubrobacteraceae bacterium]|jgi:membrane protein implicated in regulation of membrane protease activity|nr:NfeD family protein [Solirubrobacteraceae bacterium]
MESWLFWLIAAAILGIGEIATTGFFMAPFAAGALIAAIASAVGAGWAISLALFLVVSIIALAALRPIARAHLRQPAQLRTGTAALVGRNATVVERIEADSGCVRLEGELWRARAYDEDEVFEPGTRVQVLEIRGVTALVAE